MSSDGRGRPSNNWKKAVPVEGGGVRMQRTGSTKEDIERQIDETKFYTCLCCGRDDLNFRNFYSTTRNGIFKANDGYYPVCRECIDKILTDVLGEDLKSAKAFLVCAMLQQPYDEAAIRGIKSKNGGKFDVYQYNHNIQMDTTERTFISTTWDFINPHKRSYRQDDAGVDKLSAAEIQNRDTLLKMMGNDPFKTYAKRDRIFLYRELMKYFDDKIADDPYKQSQLIQIVTNNLQIHKYDILIADLDPIDDMGKIVDLNKVKSMLVQSNDKIAKENEISVRNRSDKEAGKGTLSALMKKLNEQGFEEAEANYYDQLLSEGTQWAIDESFKALQQNSFFDENDKQEIFLTQKKLVADLQAQVDTLTEENRRLRVDLSKLKGKKSLNDY